MALIPIAIALVGMVGYVVRIRLARIHRRSRVLNSPKLWRDDPIQLCCIIAWYFVPLTVLVILGELAQTVPSAILAVLLHTRGVWIWVCLRDPREKYPLFNVNKAVSRVSWNKLPEETKRNPLTEALPSKKWRKIKETAIDYRVKRQGPLLLLMIKRTMEDLTGSGAVDSKNCPAPQVIVDSFQLKYSTVEIDTMLKDSELLRSYVLEVVREVEDGKNRYDSKSKNLEAAVGDWEMMEVEDTVYNV